MGVLDAWAVEGFAESVAQLFAVVPAGFLLAALCGLVGFGVFGVFNLVRRLIGS